MIDKISLYRSFDAVARLKSISAAAKSLYVTQPSVSSDIIALEDLLGTKLFFRTNRGMKLTAEGEVLAEDVRNALAYFESGEEKIRSMNGLKSGKLNIGASDMTLRFFLLDHIKKFREKYPDIKINITNHPTPMTIEELKAGNIDFGVVSEPILHTDTDGIELIPVKTVNDIFICSADSPLARESKVGVKELSKYPLILLESNTSTRSYIDSIPSLSSLEPDIELSTSDLIIDFVKHGLGVASVVEDFAKEAISRKEICKIDLAEAIPPRSMVIARLKKAPLGVAAREILNMMKEDKYEN